MRTPKILRWRFVGGAIAALLLTLDAYAAPKNLIPNPDFEDGTVNPWTFYGQAALSVSKKGEGHNGSRALYVQVNAVGANFWDSGIQYNKAIVFNKNTQYTWAMFFKAEKARRINVKPELSVDPWTAYGETMMNVTPEWAEYYVQFKPPVDVVPASLTLHIAEVTVNFWMDDVRWYEGTYEPAEGVPFAVEPKAKLAVTWADMKTR
jgi:hypothetical protein